MFSYERIQQFNPTELRIYQYVIQHADSVSYMSIRQLASAIHVSPTTILRFCYRLDCQGYQDFKDRLRHDRERELNRAPQADLAELQHYFARVNTTAFEVKLQPALQLLRASSTIIFYGIGSSGKLAEYGARLFTNQDKFAVALTDPYYPKQLTLPPEAVIFVLSESGEGTDLMALLTALQQQKLPVLSLTNRPTCTLAKLSTWNLTYNLTSVRINGNYNATSQVPVLFSLEALAKQL
ncbi:MurR/RpiR family transcriptional regulator [Lactobacillus sp. SL9-6]|nr:MurR/RpiR family transcriptional regulator [Lactobacillus sp. SL9-6]